LSHNITTVDGLAWQKARASVGQGACVEMAPLPTGEILLRNSNRPEAGSIPFTVPEIAAMLTGAREGDFDNLVL
jgi:hypothetical protein